MLEKAFIYTMGTGVALLSVVGGVAIRIAVDALL